MYQATPVYMNGYGSTYVYQRHTYRNKNMDVADELGRNSLSKHHIQPEYGDKQADVGRDLSNPSRKTKFSGANTDKEILTFPVQLTTSRIGSLTRLIHTLAICVTIHTL